MKKIKTFVPDHVMMGLLFKHQGRAFQVVNFDDNSQKWICRPVDNYTCFRYFDEKEILENIY